MAGTTPRLVGVVVMAVFGVAGGYGVGVYTQPELSAPAGEASPLISTSVPAVSPTPRKKTPKPNNSEPLDADTIEYRRQTFVAEGATRSTITLDVPRGWRETRPADDPALARYSYSDQERWIRIRSGFPVTVPPEEAMRRLKVLLKNVAPDQALTMKPAADRNLIHDNGTRLTTSTIAYTYIPEETLKYVLVRSVGFGASGNAAVEIGVIGLPQDKKALEAILDRATRTVRRTD